MAQLILKGIGPEIIHALERRATQHGRSLEEEHRALLEAVLMPAPSRDSFKDALLSMPNVGEEADFARDRDLGRSVEL
jgi:plasmid stability protein